MSSISAGLSAPTNNVGGIIAATASPAVAHAIGDYFHNHDSEDSAAHLLAHAALGAAVAAAGGNNALIGAVSAAGGEAAAPALAHWLYGKDADDLTADEKQTISSIIGLAGAAIGATTGNSADIVSGAQIGQNAVDNNYLSQHQQKQYGKELMQCKGDWCRIKVNGKWQSVDSKQQGLLTLGILYGIPKGAFDGGYDFGTLLNNPTETYEAIKSLINSGDILGNISSALKQAYGKRIDNLIAQYEKAGISGSFDAGAEIGKLLTDIGTLLSGGAGAGKNVIQGINKVADKVADKLVHGNTYAPELAGAGNIKLPSNALANAAQEANKKPTGATKPTTGADNVATYPHLKDDLIQQNLNNIAKLDPRLAKAVKGENGQPNFNIGSGTAEEANKLGQLWVGDGAKLVGDQKKCPGCLVSADGIRLYRPPTNKPRVCPHLPITFAKIQLIQ